MCTGGAGGDDSSRRAEVARGPVVVRGKDQKDLRQPDADSEPASDEAQKKFSLALSFSDSESIAETKVKEETSDAYAIAIPDAD